MTARTMPARSAESAPLNIGKLTPIGAQRGSNDGGLYLDQSSGQRWYVKIPPSADQAGNEVLAAKLYQLAGVDVPDVHLITLHGRRAIASRFIDGLSQATPKRLAKTAGAIDHFATDAWLANWDVVGGLIDNLLTKHGRAIRVDVGGALRYRAQGTPKGAAWGDEVGELDSLRDPATAPQAAKVFGCMTREQIESSGRRLLAIDREQIGKLVQQFGPNDRDAREALNATLLARLDSIESQFGEARR